jgi:uncharacterized protein (DUF2147 family)
MRHLLVLLALVLCATASVAEAPGPVGTWSTEGGKSHVEIVPCGSQLCGRVVWLKEPLDEAGSPKTDRSNPEAGLRTRPILGLPLLSGFVPAGDGRWADGSIYNPEDGGTYNCTLTVLDADTLRVRGYVGLPLFGKTQVWNRVK